MTLQDAIKKFHETSARPPDVHHVPMRLVHQATFDELLAAAEALMRRIDALHERMVSRHPESMDRWWAGELRAAITGRKFLYRCPDHPDRQQVRSQLSARGVCCGAMIPWPAKWTQHGGSTCTKTAELVGEMDVP